MVMVSGTERNSTEFIPLWTNRGPTKNDLNKVTNKVLQCRDVMRRHADILSCVGLPTLWFLADTIADTK